MYTYDRGCVLLHNVMIRLFVSHVRFKRSANGLRMACKVSIRGLLYSSYEYTSSKSRDVLSLRLVSNRMVTRLEIMSLVGQMLKGPLTQILI